MNQDILRKKLKISKIQNNWFNYSDIAQLLCIKTASLYNWLNGAYNLSDTKAKILNQWLADLQE